jgi:Mrp family chromosome partitioning ATPase
MSRCQFDDSLPWLVETLVAELSTDAIIAGVVLRESSGRLAFFSAVALDESTAARVSMALHARLGEYARPDRSVVAADEPGARRVLSDPAIKLVEVGSVSVRYLDRRIVGADWQRGPEDARGASPRFAFASLKGGVGRSTAISVVAAEEARQGRNVLVVDLDLEAPGIGSMLLADDRLPAFGTLDFLVEQNLGAIATLELDGFVGTSGLTGGRGLVDVVPVVGTRSRDAPQNYLAKLSRAMLEGSPQEGRMIPVRDKIREMLAALERRRSYDVVLIDVRAGLAELAAGPFLALGATVLLFGTAQRQTLDSFRYLFSHLQTLVAPGERSPWAALKVVHAKAHGSAPHQLFKDQLWELFSEYLYESEETVQLEAFNYGAADPEAPHNPIPIPLDTAFTDWNPIGAPDTLVEEYYGRTFGPLLSFVKESCVRAVTQ